VVQKNRKKAKALVLFSGGLDSILAVRLLEEQGIWVEAVHFTCPFYSSGWAGRSARKLGIRLHDVPVDRAYFRMLVKPSHGYGSQMNPCIDCKVYMLRRAERLRKRLGLDFLATGEVVGERPFSQTRQALMLVEREAGLAGGVVRPLSARLLPETRAESRRLLRGEAMLSMRGRTRRPQMELARRYGIREYPAPSGGCLLTDPEYARRLRGFLREGRGITWGEGELLRYGRHFGFEGSRIVVGRNEEDNGILLGLAKKMGLAMIEVVGHPGPLTVILSRGRLRKGVVEAAAGLTVRYSDAPGRGLVRVEVKKGRTRRVVEARATSKGRLERLRI